MIHIPDFAKKEDLFSWLKANKSMLIAAKKSQLKRADAVSFLMIAESGTEIITKAEARPELLDMGEFPVKVVINTTNIFDSHRDVHIPGLWKKSLSEKKDNYLIQEHEMSFENIISDRVKAYTKTLSFAELGFSFAGITEALIFDAIVELERNEYMAEQYAKGRVKNHSVGMQYIKLELAVNSESRYDAEEKAVWDKYIDQIANREAAEEVGYFWAVTEARLIEGSAVVMGSNFVTPTLQIGKQIALENSRESTEGEPHTSKIDYSKLINLKFSKQ